MIRNLDDECASSDQNRGPMFVPQARASIANHAAGRQPTLIDAPPLQLAPVEHLQHVVHEPREIVDGRDGGLVLDMGTS